MSAESPVSPPSEVRINFVSIQLLLHAVCCQKTSLGPPGVSLLISACPTTARDKNIFVQIKLTTHAQQPQALSVSKATVNTGTTTVSVQHCEKGMTNMLGCTVSETTRVYSVWGVIEKGFHHLPSSPSKGSPPLCPPEC